MFINVKNAYIEIPTNIPILAAIAGTRLVKIPIKNIPIIGTLYKPLTCCRYVNIDCIWDKKGAIIIEANAKKTPNLFPTTTINSPEALLLIYPL